MQHCIICHDSRFMGKLFYVLRGPGLFGAVEV